MKQVTKQYARSVSFMFPCLSHLLTSYPPVPKPGNGHEIIVKTNEKHYKIP
jgi:hypothetical protein